MDNPPILPDSLAAAALPVPTVVVPGLARSTPPPKHFLAVFFLSFFLGVFGADRFYLGRYPSAIFKLLTFGGFGIAAIVDLALVMNGALRDSHDRLPVGYEEYKGLARRTVLWVAIGTGLFIAVNAVLIFTAVEGVINKIDTGGTSSLLGGNSSTGGSDESAQLQQLLSQSGL